MRLAKVVYTIKRRDPVEYNKFYTTNEWRLMKLDKEDPIDEEDVLWFLSQVDVLAEIELVEWEEIDPEDTREVYVTYTNSRVFDTNFDDQLYMDTMYLNFPVGLRMDGDSIKEVSRVLYNTVMGFVIAWSIPIEKIDIEE